jgi:hypothetical protein
MPVEVGCDMSNRPRRPAVESTDEVIRSMLG